LRCRRAQKRFRERQKVKQQEAVQRVVQLEEALDRLEVERSELSQRLQAMATGRGGEGGGGGPLATPPKAEDSGSEVRPHANELACACAICTICIDVRQSRQHLHLWIQSCAARRGVPA
jgi:hypothetical protein